MDKNSLQNDVIDVCLRRGIVFPTAEIYNSYAGFYEYGPVGVKLRENLMVLWQQTFINSEDNVHEISGSTIMPEAVFDASGHLDGFHDPLTQCDKCNSMFRIDHLIEELGLEGTKGLSTPAVRPSMGSIQADKKLAEEKITHFRTLAARANYLSADRPECQFAAKEILRFMAEPTALSAEALKRMGRHLVQYPRRVLGLP